jgi:hypothetical protein
MVKNELQSTMSVVIETKQDIRSLPNGRREVRRD